MRESSIPVLRPHVPNLSNVSRLLEEIGHNRQYTNHGPMEVRLREEFSALLGTNTNADFALFSSGTIALTACLRAFELPPGSGCLVPSWTFVGTVCAIANAGLTPIFIDVDRQSWAPSCDMLRHARSVTGARAAVVVAPFGGMVDYPELVSLARETGLVIAIDAAAALHAVERIAASTTELPLPIMVSLHATKLTPALEGGLVVWSNPIAIKAMIAWSNFGILDSDPIEAIGCNGKLSEVHAAYGLTSLRVWPDVRARMLTVANLYRQMFADRHIDAEFAPNVVAELASSTFNIIVNELPNDAEDQLGRAKVETRRWWRSGVHNIPAFQHLSRLDLSVTEGLAQTVLGIPFSYELKHEDQAFVADQIKTLVG